MQTCQYMDGNWKRYRDWNYIFNVKKTNMAFFNALKRKFFELDEGMKYNHIILILLVILYALLLNNNKFLSIHKSLKFVSLFINIKTKSICTIKTLYIFSLLFAGGNTIYVYNTFDKIICARMLLVKKCLTTSIHHLHLYNE